MILPVIVFLPMVMGPVSYALGKKSKRLRNILYAVVCCAVCGLCICTVLSPCSFSMADFCAFGLNFEADGFRSIYALIAAFMWMMTSFLSQEYFIHYHNRNRYYFFSLLTLGATLGVLLSKDLFTTFIFFEVMSLTSYTWVAHEETPQAMKAAGTYLTVAVIGGLTTLMGLFMLYRQLGTLDFVALRQALSEGSSAVYSASAVRVASWLTLFGFAAKAGLFPLHIWLPKAHPVAPAPASALLSGILTKSGVFGMIVVCADIRAGSASFGTALFILAAVTMFLGALMALFSVDLKRTLACSSMSQIGFITFGLSVMTLLKEEGGLAASGALLHMVNHSLIKLCLFMCAGVIYMNLHKLDLNQLKGYGRKKPLLHISFLLGALAIACIPPLGSGYISKSLIHEGVLEYISLLKETGGAWLPFKLAEILFLISGGLTIAYMTKLYICIFWEKNNDKKLQQRYDQKTRYMTPLSAAALLLSAIIFPVFCLLPGTVMTPIIHAGMSFFGQQAPHHLEYYSLQNLIGAGESMLIGAAVYLLIVRKLMIKKGEYLNLWPRALDLEQLLYRPLLTNILPGIAGAVSKVIHLFPERFFPVLKTCGLVLARVIGEGPEWIIILIRRTALKKRLAPVSVPVGTRFTYYLGLALNRINRLLNKLFRSADHPLRTDMEYVTSRERDKLLHAELRISRSMSYGLLLMAVGLLITCLYLLLT